MSQYASRIQAARAYAGLTQPQLAERLGIAVETIKRREKGTHDPNKGERIAIASICGVPASFMEHGFGMYEESDVIRRLERIEAMLRELGDRCDQAETP